MTDSDASTVRVILPLPVGDGYDYLAPDDAILPEGSVVEVPLANRRVFGVVWGKGGGEIERQKLKKINRIIDVSPLSPVSRRFVDWVSAYTLAPKGQVLKMVLGGKLQLAKDGDSRPAGDPKTRGARLPPPPDPDHLPPKLAVEQAAAAAMLVDKVRRRGFSVTLLDGVTGSGKTEVYAEAVAEALRQGRQALVLLPEIAMTAALIDRLTARFGARPVAWHSELTDRQRRLHWNGIVDGQARFVLGARSALFLPYADLGVIVVDEEHEGAYKQEEGVIYHGRDMAVVRARMGNIPVVLASATPSLESVNNVNSGKYAHAVMRKRYGGAEMPYIELVDMRRETLAPQQFLSAPLLAALRQAKADGKQSLLFLNRRGYAPLTLCRPCGHRMQCPNCTSWLIEHKRTGRLHCHYCGHAERIPTLCPSCGADGAMAACGPGIERILEEVKQRFPEARSMVAASDTLTGPQAAQELVDLMKGDDIDILIGTQIMAKGYHFPRLAAVGVVDADLGLYGADPRASERTFQLLQQVAGRSGREGAMGRVLLQTTAPDHPVMRAIKDGDRDGFIKAEMQERELYFLPPFSRMATITVSGSNADQVATAAKVLASFAPQHEGVRVLGPAPAPVTVLRGRTRHRMMIRCRRNFDLPEIIRRWLAAIPPPPRTLRIIVDMDPQSFS